MKQTALDPSKRLDIYLRVDRVASKTFTMVDENGDPYSLVYEDFQVIIKRYPGDRKNTIFLEIGSGLTIANINELTIDITATQSDITPGEYYWEMYKPDDGQTWLSGKAFFHEGEFDGVTSDASSIQINEDGVINIEIGGSASVDTSSFLKNNEGLQTIEFAGNTGLDLINSNENTTLRIRNNGASGMHIGSVSSNTVFFLTNNTFRMRLSNIGLAVFGGAAEVVASANLDIAGGPSTLVPGLRLRASTSLISPVLNGAIQHVGSHLYATLNSVDYQLDNREGALMPSYTVSGVPSASPAGRIIFVSDEAGGAVPAFSDGTNWRRVTDRNIIT